MIAPKYRVTARATKARASLAARLLLAGKLGRELDNCFEQGDGDEVCRLLGGVAAVYDRLREAMSLHLGREWAERCIEAGKGLVGAGESVRQ